MDCVVMVKDIVGTKEPSSESAEERAARINSEKKEFDRIMKLVQSFDTAGNRDGNNLRAGIFQLTTTCIYLYVTKSN